MSKKAAGIAGFGFGHGTAGQCRRNPPIGKTKIVIASFQGCLNFNGAASGVQKPLPVQASNSTNCLTVSTFTLTMCAE